MKQKTTNPDITITITASADQHLAVLHALSRIKGITLIDGKEPSNYDILHPTNA